MAEAIVYIDGEIVSSTDGVAEPYTTLGNVRAQLDWQQPFDSIRVKINSIGGSVIEGLAIRDYLKSLNLPLHTEVMGQCASIATLIFVAGNTRQMAKHSRFFIHLPYGGISGVADEGLAYFQSLKAMEQDVIKLYSEITGQSIDVLFEMCRKQTELTANEALDYGFATSIAQEVMAKLTDLPMAKSKQQINQNEKMNNEDKKEVKGWIDKLEEKLNKFFERKEAKALALTLEDGRAVTISGETETAQEGQEVTLTESGEALPDGSYKLSNGQTITVADGKITAVTTEESEASKENEDVKALKEKLDALEKENATLKTAKADAEAKAQKVEGEAKAQAEEMKALKTDFEGFKSKLETSGFIPRDENNKREESKAKAEDAGTAALENIRKKREERKTNNKK